MEERDFEDLLRESDVRGCLYEPQYSETQLRLTEEQEAVAAEERSLPGGHEEEPVQSRAGADWWCQCSRCAPMDTEIPKVNGKRQPKPAGTNGRFSINIHRLTAYRHFVEWVLQGERLGKGYIVLFCLPVLFRTSDRDFQLVTDNSVAIKKLLKLWKSYECAI
ncbi:hypothetical protein DPEC_G00035490 [Dallia pectoralis]|uniref:Uncharacterized protein n=1 Tax=Dallia pectoralis TaxID=75939 RepID=A0ACC2HDK6_DALPE|nr:hypothetical protein DPEC_G00035490 [Dallia pectoralis]